MQSPEHLCQSIIPQAPYYGMKAHVQVDIHSSMSSSRRTTERSAFCILEDSRNHRYQSPRNPRCGYKTILIVLALVTMLLVQYKNNIYTLSFVRSIASFDSFTNLQRYALTDIVSTNYTTNVASTARRRRVLIAQYTASTQSFSSASPNNIYDQFLWMTSKVNAAYAVQWQHDFWIMRGIAYAHPNGTDPQQYYNIEKWVINGHRQSLHNEDSRRNSTLDYTIDIPDDVPPSRSTYNKIAILELALTATAYDGLLILDADAMMYDFSRDIADLLSPNSVLVAHKTNSSEGPHTGSINAGVTLWNLRHKLTPYVAERWKSKCLRRIEQQSDDKLDDDQAPLQFLLKYELDQNRREKVVYAIENEFHYARGTFIRHFIRPAGSTWTNNTMDSESTRLMKIERSANEVCTKNRRLCDY